MSKQVEHAKFFHSLHVAGDPVVLFNIWDAGGAAAVAKAGARAIATGSAPVALANGFLDGENLPLDFALANIVRITNAVDLPVTMDLEGGYGVPAENVATTVGKAMNAGVVGFNFEDQVVGGEGLHSIDVQSARITAARKAVDATRVKGFINARTDIFLKAKRETHDMSMLREAIERGKAFEQAGADGFFAPGLADEALIAELCRSVSLPVNIIALPGVPDKKRLTELGVARISYGPVPYKQIIQNLEAAAAAAFA
ncbi:MAG: isocitrate lyase/phosphoenolpyruvate mutase family protein [Granulosicoccus sp.]